MPFKILALDGGGIRGIYGAEILARAERDLPEGDNIADYFDMIAGTSTGGIIGIGLALKLNARRVADIYVKRGKEVFPSRRFLKASRLKALRQYFSVLYDAWQLESILREEFGEALIGDAETRLVIPSFLIPKTEIAVIKTDHHADFQHDWKMKAWLAARATSAAPSYLSGVAAGRKFFIDGGVWANNPIMVAVVDALSSYDIEREQIEILSLGTGSSPFDIGGVRSGGLISWRNAIHASMYLTTDNALSQARLLIGHERIERLDPGSCAAEIELDDVDLAIDKLVPVARRHYDENANYISRFFRQRVAMRERHYSVY
ncbi:CBASS cGAMP-activated phospholipase [Tepidicaulis sp. LMO-SS28]|uniref:CBASS cGAMP-activated phospholipase n=1 Tax=Tepidicaulis sp. LMO-SS28 TaxID=3447455 RepID=UPI003EE0BAE9